MSGTPRILILGAGGQVGTELQRSFAGLGVISALGREQVDLGSEERIRRAIREAAPQIILNAAAYTAVDKAESEPALAMAINADAPRVLAEEALRSGALLVHYSTDYVFDGTKAEPWAEADLPHPLNLYGASKLAGEEAIRDVGGRYLIFRTSWVYGPHGKNFLLTMLRLGGERDQLRIVDDQIGAPTSSLAIADSTRSIVERILSQGPGAAPSWAGLYHMTCGGSVSWCGFARAIFDRAQSLPDGRIPLLTPIPTSEYPTPAQRPRNSVLSCEKLYSRFGVRLPHWEAALDKVMSQLAARHVPA